MPENIKNLLQPSNYLVFYIIIPFLFFSNPHKLVSFDKHCFFFSTLLPNYLITQTFLKRCLKLKPYLKAER